MEMKIGVRNISHEHRLARNDYFLRTGYTSPALDKTKATIAGSPHSGPTMHAQHALYYMDQGHTTCISYVHVSSAAKGYSV